MVRTPMLAVMAAERRSASAQTAGQSIRPRISRPVARSVSSMAVDAASCPSSISARQRFRRSAFRTSNSCRLFIVYNMIFLADLGDYQAMNEVYGSYFPENPPARACVQAGLVKPEFLVEIAATAVIDE